MFLRSLLIVPFAAAITFTLFVLMVQLVAEPDAVSENELPLSVFQFLPQIEDTEVDEVDRTPERKPVLYPEIPELKYDAPTREVPGGEMVPIAINPANPPILDRGTGDSDAIAVLRPAPFYPNRAASKGIEGWVIVEFTVSSAGSVRGPIRIIASEPSGVFDRQAIKAVKRWKYRPKRVGGKTVEQHGVTAKLTFELDKS